MSESANNAAGAAGVLLACEAQANNPQQGREAFLTWCMAEALGWPAARARRTHSTWFRHLRVLRAAGILVPRQDIHASNWLRVGWDGEEAQPSLGARLLGLVNARFRVAKPWKDAAFPYAPGTVGRVESIQFRDLSWWAVVELDGSPGGWEELPIWSLVKHTEWLRDAQH